MFPGEQLVPGSQHPSGPQRTPLSQQWPGVPTQTAEGEAQQSPVQLAPLAQQNFSAEQLDPVQQSSVVAQVAPCPPSSVPPVHSPF